MTSEEEESCDPITKSDICFLKLFKCVHTFGNQILFKVTKDLYYHHPESKLGTLILDEFCFAVRKKGIKKEGGKTIDPSYKFQYDPRIPEEKQLDISDCITLLRIFNKDHPFKKYEAQWEELYSSLNEIKTIRNELSHTHLKSLYSTQFKKYIDNLIQYIKSICNCMKFLIESEECYLIWEDELPKKIDEVWSTNLDIKKKEDKVTLFEYQKLMDSDHFQKYLQQFREELIKHYTDLFTNTQFLFTDLPNIGIDEIFTPVILEVHNKQLQFLEILKAKLKQKDASAVIVCGDAGHGKTTLCKKITLDWAKSSNSCIYGITAYDLVLLIEVRRATERGLAEYLKNILLSKSTLYLSEDDIYSILKQLKVLIIIDAYDEKSSDAHSLISSLFDIMSNQKFIITTRPQFHKDVYCCLQDFNLLYLDVQIKGFRKQECRVFIEKVWKVMMMNEMKCGDSKHYASFLDDLRDDFREIIKVPLVNLLLISLWVKGKINRESLKTITFTNLYTKFLDLQKETICTQMNHCLPNLKIHNQEKLDCIIEKLINLVAKSVYENKLIKVTSIDHSIVSSVQNFCKINLSASPECARKIFSSLFLSTPTVRSHLTINKENEFEFLHKTQMEYLAAIHIFQKLTNEKEKVVFNDIELFKKENIDENWGELSLVLGLLSNEGKVSYISLSLSQIVEDNIFDSNLLWKLLKETMRKQENEIMFDNSLCQLIRENLTKKRKLGWRFYEMNLVAALSLMQHVNRFVYLMEIELSHGFEPCTKENASFLVEIQKFQKWMRKKNPSVEIKVELHIMRHLRVGAKSSGKMLELFNGWANITKFSGCLTHNTMNCLRPFKDLEKVHLYLNSAECLISLTKLFESGKSQPNLKEVKFIFEMPFEDMPSIPPMKPELKILVEFLIIKDKKKESPLIRMLEKLKTGYGLFFSVTLHYDIKPKDAGNLIEKLDPFIHERLIIHSVYDIEDEEKFALSRPLHCHLKWNE